MKDYTKETRNILKEIRGKAADSFENKGEKYMGMYEKVISTHMNRITDPDAEKGNKYMNKCLTRSVKENSGLVADYLAEKDPDFAISLMGLPIANSARIIADTVIDNTEILDIVLGEDEDKANNELDILIESYFSDELVKYCKK